jgi:hypothetical protein
MNQIFEATGTLLYVVVSIVLSPLIIFTHCIILSWITLKHVKAWSRDTRRMRSKRRREAYPYLLNVDLHFN